MLLNKRIIVKIGLISIKEIMIILKYQIVKIIMIKNIMIILILMITNILMNNQN